MKVSWDKSQPARLLATACTHTHACLCTRTSAVTRCSYYMILTAQCKNFNFLFKMLAFASIRSPPPSKFAGSAHPCRDPKSPLPLSNSVSGMHCGIDKSLCTLLLLNPSLADQTLCLIATIGKGVVQLFPNVVIR